MQTSPFPKGKLTAFALLSVCDFAITYLLLSGNRGAVYESNPVANQWLTQGGWLGLAVFKVALCSAVAVITTFLYYRRPRIAHDVLALACGAVVVAVLSGATIAVTKPRAVLEEGGPETGNGMNRVSSGDPRTSEYVANLRSAGNKLAAKEWTLAEGVEHVRDALLAGDPVWIDSLRSTYPGLEDRALLAADLLQQTVSTRVRMLNAVALANRLENEFRELYGIVPTLPYRLMLRLGGNPAAQMHPGMRALPLPPPKNS